MFVFKMVHWFMGKVVKKIALTLEVTKESLVAYELNVVASFKCLAGICAKAAIPKVKENT